MPIIDGDYVLGEPLIGFSQAPQPLRGARRGSLRCFDAFEVPIIDGDYALGEPLEAVSGGSTASRCQSSTATTRLESPALSGASAASRCPSSTATTRLASPRRSLRRLDCSEVPIIDRDYALGDARGDCFEVPIIDGDYVPEGCLEGLSQALRRLRGKDHHDYR